MRSRSLCRFLATTRQSWGIRSECAITTPATRSTPTCAEAEYRRPQLAAAVKKAHFTTRYRRCVALRGVDHLECLGLDLLAVTFSNMRVPVPNSTGLSCGTPSRRALFLSGKLGEDGLEFYGAPLQQRQQPAQRRHV